MTDFVPASWLLGAVDMHKIEQNWLDKPGPYGIPKEEWDQLKAEIEDGDEIRAFSSPEDFWANLAGRAGYALVREGKAIAEIVTFMN